MSVTVLDRAGRKLEKGSRVAVAMPMFDSPYTVVALHEFDDGRASVGLYRGSFDEYQPSFCIPYVPSDPTAGGYMARDLELIPAGDQTEGSE
ncbi:MAG TPA: hypothetical protein VEW07_13310 [Solirubrobacterales bacterium]|nr:hypothetical protein [Solirubrobacterales bacterium]